MLSRLERAEAAATAQMLDTGFGFEAWAASVVFERAVDIFGEGTMVLQNVRYGNFRSAAGEIDLVVVREVPAAEIGLSKDSTENSAKPSKELPRRFVKVLAFVESKRNADDIGLAFGSYQSLLAWLVGERTRYDPQQFACARFPSGHFEGSARLEHAENGVRWTFSPQSFSAFRRDEQAGLYVDNLWFCTLVPQKALTGINARGRQRLIQRCAERSLASMGVRGAAKALAMAELEVEPVLDDTCFETLRGLYETGEVHELAKRTRKGEEAQADAVAEAVASVDRVSMSAFDVLHLYHSRDEWAEQVIFVKNMRGKKV